MEAMKTRRKRGLSVLGLLGLVLTACTATPRPSLTSSVPAVLPQSSSEASKDRCDEPEGQLLDCLVSFRVDVPDWTDRGLLREQREGGPKALLLPPGTDEVWVAMLVGPAAVRVYSRSTGEPLTSFPLGDAGLGAVEFEITADGKTVYVSQLESSLISPSRHLERQTGLHMYTSTRSRRTQRGSRGHGPRS